MKRKHSVLSHLISVVKCSNMKTEGKQASEAQRDYVLYRCSIFQSMLFVKTRLFFNLLLTFYYVDYDFLT